MSDNEQNIRNAIGVYRFNAIMGMVKGTAVVLAAAGGLYLSLTDGMQNANTTGWLYKNLGPEGLKLLAIALCVAALLVGLWWAYTSFRDLTVGVKAYKDELNEQGIGLKTYKAERNGQSPITARPYDM